MQLINDMERMQQEAVRRAREMQQRARIPTPPKAEAPPPEEHTEKQSHPRQEAPLQETQSFSEVLFKDKEKTLILCLILLLTDEKSDSSLIFALLYLLI